MSEGIEEDFTDESTVAYVTLKRTSYKHYVTTLAPNF